MSAEPEPNLILPVGTQVVTRIEVSARSGRPGVPRGAVGVITEAPLDQLHHYRIRLPDGGEILLTRREFFVRKQHQGEGLDRTAAVSSDIDSYAPYIIYRCIVGSRAYGLDTDKSDVDRRGIYLSPADLHWSLYGVPEQVEDPETEECYWELQKFLTLALKANPNVLECLYTPLVETASPIAKELLGMRTVFLSRLIYQTYNGYVLSQFRKLEQDLRAKGAIKWKHAMHLIRLLLSGVTALREEEVPVRVGEHRDRLLAIRRGEIPWADVDAWRLSLHREFDSALQTTRLPERPDYEAVNAFLLRARRSCVGGEGKP